MSAQLARGWHLIAYPRLRELPPGERRAALARARAAGFDTIERVAILASIVLTTYLLQSVGGESESVIERYLTQLVLAVGLLAALAGPFLLRRTRRGLDLELTRHDGGDPCNSNSSTPGSARKQVP